MRQRLRLFLNYAIFWIGFQVALRAIFLLYNHHFAADLNTSELFQVFWHGLKMDLSISGYFLAVTGIMLTISVFVQERWLYVIFHTLSIAFIILCCIIMMVDLELYRHWGFRLDTTPLFYITGAESEAMGSVDISVVIKLFLILAATVVIALFVYSTWLMPNLKTLEPAAPKKALVLLLITGAMFIPIRGSFSVAPMNTGFVYFHKTKVFANHAAINVVWNFLYSFGRTAGVRYPENFYEPSAAEKEFKNFYPQSDSTFHLFTTKKPNIILFILESFTADVIEPLGGIPELTPNLNALCREGILFDNFYASGDRTDKGVVSILSAYPAQPQTNIIKFPSKTEKLPYLIRYINDLGYNTSFDYGGDIDFANFRSYFTNSQFKTITTEDDFPDEDPPSKWGYHDHIVLKRAFEECDTTRSPFFKVILTLSSHEPFDVPMTPVFTSHDEDSLFLNAIHYTDKTIGTFIDSAKRSSWWNNTVIMFVADHGHRQPGNKPLNDRKRFRIPFIMTGGALRMDSVIHTFGNQTDIANTILAQLDRPVPAFRFSKDLLAPNAVPFAFYFYNNGYGFVAPEKYCVYDHTAKAFVTNTGMSKTDLDLTKAYQQVEFSDYNAK